MIRHFLHQIILFIEIIFFISITFLLFNLDAKLAFLRPLIYITGIVYIFIITRLTKISRKQMGITTKNFSVSMKNLTFPMICAVLGILLVHYFMPELLTLNILSWASGFGTFGRIYVYIFVSAPIQEFIFRGFFISRLENLLRNKSLIVLISSLIFSFIHLPFGSTLMTVATFIFGILLATNFLRFRNIFSIILAHAVIGGILLLFVN